MPYAQKMGSKEKNTPGNFSEKDSKLISKSTQSKLSRGEVKNFLQSQAPKKPEVVGSSGGLSVIGGIVGAGVKAAGRAFSAFSNASSQYLKSSKTKQNVVSAAKQLKQASKTKQNMASAAKQLKKATTRKAKSSYSRISYANPRISMTKAQRDKAGY